VIPIPPAASSVPLTVASWDVDARGRLTTTALGRWMQETAEVNAASLGAGFDDLRAAGQTWVLVGVLMRLARSPRWRERVELVTWPRTLERRRALRDFRLHAPDGEVLATATTAWYCLDLTTGRPVDPQRWRTGDWPAGERATERDPARLPGLDDAGDEVTEIAVPLRWSDLDLNGHLTNTRYHELLLESYPADWLAAHAIAELELNFMAEGRYPDTVLCRRDPEREGGDGPADGPTWTWRHALVRTGDGREIARARLVWR
jgi:acyl-CoA thioesterase FadM